MLITTYWDDLGQAFWGGLTRVQLSRISDGSIGGKMKLLTFFLITLFANQTFAANWSCVSYCRGTDDQGVAHEKRFDSDGDTMSEAWIKYDNQCIAFLKAEKANNRAPFSVPTLVCAKN